MDERLLAFAVLPRSPPRGRGKDKLPALTCYCGQVYCFSPKFTQ